MALRTAWKRSCGDTWCMPPPGEFALSRSTLLLSSRVHLVREKALGKAQGLEERVPAKLESCPSDSWCFPGECLRASPRQWQQLWKPNRPVRRLTNFWPQVSLSHKKPLFGQLKSLRQSLWHTYVRTYVHIHLPPSEPSP